MTIKVKAVRTGLYEDKLRHKGEVFDLRKPEDFSDFHRRFHPGWMTLVDATPQEKAKLDDLAKKRERRIERSKNQRFAVVQAVHVDDDGTDDEPPDHEPELPEPKPGEPNESKAEAPKAPEAPAAKPEAKKPRRKATGDEKVI